MIASPTTAIAFSNGRSGGVGGVGSFFLPLLLKNSFDVLCHKRYAGRLQISQVPNSP